LPGRPFSFLPLFFWEKKNGAFPLARSKIKSSFNPLTFFWQSKESYKENLPHDYIPKQIFKLFAKISENIKMTSCGKFFNAYNFQFVVWYSVDADLFLKFIRRCF